MTATIILALLLTTAVPVPKQDGKPCPANYRSEAHYCVPANRDSPIAVPKGNSQCPSGWLASGGFCLAPPRSE